MYFAKCNIYAYLWFRNVTGGECMKTNERPDEKETKCFKSKVWDQKEGNR